MSTLPSPQEREFRALYLGRPNTRKRRRFLSHGSKTSSKPGKISQRGQIRCRVVEDTDPEEFRVTLEQRAFSHRYYKEKRAGMYNCICCGAPLFSSGTKYDSGTGWPSFYALAVGGAVSEDEDRSLFMRRTEARFAKCESHLGHVFSDGPNPTGTLYCINGAALKHDADKKSGNSSR
jgi:peptide-methionine (R)-S-oxide reductase